jgi:hypothetical protein
MAKHLEKVVPGEWAHMLASDSEAYFGRVRRARDLADEVVVGEVARDHSENGGITLSVAAQWEAAYGNSTSAREMATKAYRLAPTSLAVGAEAAFAFALAGDTARAL